MVGLFAIGAATLGCYTLYRAITKWQRNRQIALTSGFPVYSSPIHFSDVWWALFYPLFTPFLYRLPRSWINPWLPMAETWTIWKTSYRPFADAGTDTFMVATPAGNMLWSCDHAILNQLLLEHPKVEVPVEMVGFYDIWGPTVGSVDGDDWKTHRRVITAGFGNQINSTVWKEALRQTSTLAQHWLADGAVIPRMQKWTSRLALHVICCGFFNQRLSWTDDFESTEPERTTSSEHRIPLDRAILLLMSRLATIFMTPRAFLGKLPGRNFREANLGLTETTKYLQTLRAQAEENIEELANKKNKTLLESIVLSGAAPSLSGKKSLPESSVYGNLFFTLMAGHETTGCTMGFMFILLAIYPDIQTKLQAELDAQFGSRPVDEWTMETDYQPLQRGILGAIMKETLVLYNPVSWLPRKVVEPVTVTDSQGQVHTVPANTLSPLAIAAAMHNTRVWIDRPVVSSERRAKCHDSPALYFNPQRWIGVDDSQRSTPTSAANNGMKDSKMLPDHPLWWSFGQGPRACPGQAFARAEMTAAMAVLFKYHSLELVVGEDTLKQCGGNRAKAWEETRDRAITSLYDDIQANITISVGVDLPLRIVERVG